MGQVEAPRSDWTETEAQTIYNLPILELLFRAQTVHRHVFGPFEVETATLLSIKTAGCPEDCSYCSQSAKWETGLKASKLMQVEQGLADARRAHDAGATRFRMGAAWRSPKDRDLNAVRAMIRGVKALGMKN